MYQMANTTVSIIRGTVADDTGDLEDEGTVIASGVIAFISSPGPSPYQPKILGTTVFDPSDELPSVVRTITGVVPFGTDVTVDDQVLDEHSGYMHRVRLATQQGNLGGLFPDLYLILERVTSTQPA